MTHPVQATRRKDFLSVLDFDAADLERCLEIAARVKADRRLGLQAPTATALNGRHVAAGPIDAFIDGYGHGYVELALELGVRPERINTIVDFPAVEKHGVKFEGNAAAANADVLAEIARLIDEGQLEIPIANTYPLSDVQAAYRELESGHLLGKIVLEP